MLQGFIGIITAGGVEAVTVRSITIDGTKVPSTQTNFPVMLSGTYSYLATIANGGGVKSNNGYDILFYSDIGLTTKLDHEIEKYVSTTGEILMWVRVPTLNGTTNTTIYMSYGDSSLTSNPSTSNTWESNFKGVWHLPDGTTLTANDSTVNGVNGTVNSATAVAGKFYGGADFASANTAYIDLGNNLTLASNQPFTWTGWVNMDDITAGANRIIGDQALHDNTQGWSIFRHIDYLYFNYRVSTADASNILQNRTLNSAFTAGAWVHCAVTKSSSRLNSGLKFYINGSNSVSQGTPDANTLSSDYTNAVNARMGSHGSGGSYMNGILDEMRVAWVERSADWITAEYNNQNSPSTFYTISNPL